ncbi:hypothetical protein TSOC_009904 [Tetrabaena socialis]|uniref:Uncharacterized protein n=1 Tax=Tetrabaena socialis TaxID=47790 RepID=A0A2J7ZUN7_9CHLO|nr:hypothetical protein TSOC_009904 [Tetrabaena socialis]|eukprot:PNH03993.1 hypothetical protein TSOC_009904 [Tetrabaena socialis]
MPLRLHLVRRVRGGGVSIRIGPAVARSISPKFFSARAAAPMLAPICGSTRMTAGRKVSKHRCTS